MAYRVTRGKYNNGRSNHSAKEVKCLVKEVKCLAKEVNCLAKEVYGSWLSSYSWLLGRWV